MSVRRRGGSMAPELLPNAKAFAGTRTWLIKRRTSSEAAELQPHGKRTRIASRACKLQQLTWAHSIQRHHCHRPVQHVTRAHAAQCCASTHLLLAVVGLVRRAHESLREHAVRRPLWAKQRSGNACCADVLPARTPDRKTKPQSLFCWGL